MRFRPFRDKPTQVAVSQYGKEEKRTETIIQIFPFSFKYSNYIYIIPTRFDQLAIEVGPVQNNMRN